MQAHKKYRVGCVFLLLLLCLNRAGVVKAGDRNCVDSGLHLGTSIDSLTHELFDALPGGDFYLIGETHNFIANNDLLLALVKTLQPKGVYNIVNELPHASCFLFNEYLSTGDERLLAEIRPKASYQVLKDIYAFNQRQPEGKRIKFYGIDYMDVDDLDNLSLSLKRIGGKLAPEPNRLYGVIAAYAARDTITRDDAVAFNAVLDRYLNGDSAAYYKQYFGPYYADLALMASNIVGTKGRSDKTIFNGFLSLYRYCFSNGEASPKFLAMYGFGHLKGFGTRLSADKASPVKNKTIIVGLQYYECHGDWPWRQERRYNDGVAFFFPEKDFDRIRERLYRQPGMQIGVLPNKDKCISSKAGRPDLDGLIFFKQYGSRRMRSWKFD
ncbi:hypothetical protein [Taibaiella koreensis]|uniref:hypothetical protein n=1 Tax=Taibaiella koreensis TaxID=1268548 RepID=UPI000E599301|nr:hypothetical protein [Taibaiella koreensis]